MKTIFHLCVVAFISFATLSCTKTDLSKLTAETPVNNDPYISSKIDKYIVQPGSMELGTSSAIMHQGDSVTIFLPYSVVNESFVTSKVTMTDDATGLPINTYDLVSYTDPSASQLKLPDDLFYHPEFFFVTFVADESYTGKTVSITTTLEGQTTYSSDVLNGAFSIIP
jgi:hypothetical protein